MKFDAVAPDSAHHPQSGLDTDHCASPPSAIPLSVAHALIRCNASAPLGRSWLRRKVLPSTETTVPAVLKGTVARTRSSSTVSRATGSSNRRNRLKVSWEAMPAVTSKMVSSHGSLARHYAAISSQESAPHSTPPRAIITKLTKLS